MFASSGDWVIQDRIDEVLLMSFKVQSFFPRHETLARQKVLVIGVY
jgi:hypothetical protein